MHVDRAPLVAAAQLEERQEAEAGARGRASWRASSACSASLKALPSRNCLRGTATAGMPRRARAREPAGALLRRDHAAPRAGHLARVDALEQVLEARAFAREQHGDAQRRGCAHDRAHAGSRARGASRAIGSACRSGGPARRARAARGTGAWPTRRRSRASAPCRPPRPRGRARARSAISRGRRVSHRAAQVREAHDRHDARHDRHRDAGGARALDEAEVVLVVEEELRDQELGAGVDLAPQVREIGRRARRFGVHLRVAGAADAERRRCSSRTRPARCA